MGDDSIHFEDLGRSDCLGRRKNARYFPASQRAVQNIPDRSDPGDSKETLKPEDVILTPSKRPESPGGEDCGFAAPTVTDVNATGHS
jgi:hypothetical protein